MKIIYNKLIPMKGYKAVNLFGVLFAREGARLTADDIRHEEIHTAQMRETLYGSSNRVLLSFLLHVEYRRCTMARR